MTEKTFEREVLDRLVTIETKLDPFVTNCRDCHAKIDNLIVAQIKTDASARSAHQRIDGMYKTAGVVAAVVSGIMSLVQFVIQTRGGGQP